MTAITKRKLISLGCSLVFLLLTAAVNGWDTRFAAQGSAVMGDGTYAVVRVADGDTFSVDIDGITETVRLIGLDTPETVDPRKPVQCFGKEASDRAKASLMGARVRLEKDPSQGERDKYGRLLRYAFLADGTNYALSAIREGYALEYTYDGAYAYQEAFRDAERSAEEEERGLWAEDTCAGDTTKAAN